MIKAKIHQQEILKTIIPTLENFYKFKFKINGPVQKNVTSNASAKENVAFSDKTESVITNTNENTKLLVNENRNKEETSRKLKDSEIINFTTYNSNVSGESKL